MASLILVTAVAYTCSWLYSVKRVFKVGGYRYVAINLARDILEFGASGNFSHPFKLRYNHAPARGCSICPDDTATGHSPQRGYALKEWWFFAPSNPNPFTYMGDIKARGLVPRQAPDSVDIVYEVLPDPAFYDAYRERVSVSWEEDGRKRTQEYSRVAMSHVNDQLQLQLREFSWQ